MIRLEDVVAAVPGAPGETGERTVLRSVNATILPGECRLLLGANGSGKTTLLRLLAGLAAPASGRVLRHRDSPQPADGRGTQWPDIAVLFEEPDPQFLGYSVEAEVAFGLESLGLPQEEIRVRVGEALEQFEIRDLAGRAPHTLSAGEKARTLLAAASAGRPRLLLLDQALAHLDPRARRSLEERLVREALAGDRAVLRTEQDGLAAHPGESLHWLREGTLHAVSDLAPEEIINAEDVPFPLPLQVSAALARAGLWQGPLAADPESLLDGGRLEARPAHGRPGPARAAASPAPAEPVAGQMVLEVSAVAWAPRGRGAAPILEGIEFGLARGEIVAVIGPTGAGKSTLLRLASGLEAPTAGRIRHAPPSPAWVRPAALALEYPERQLFGRTVLEDVAALLWVQGMLPADRARNARRALGEVGLDPDRFADRSPITLSEGEKRRAALAGVLVDPPQLLLLDEPTAGLDPLGRRQLARALLSLGARGRAVLFASHDLDFVSAVADRALVLARRAGEPGTLAGQGPAAAIVRDAPLMERAGLRSPDFVPLERSLRAAGLLGARPVRDRESLRSALAETLEARAAPAGSGAAP